LFFSRTRALGTVDIHDEGDSGTGEEVLFKAESALIRTILTDAQWERIAPLLPGKEADPGAPAATIMLWIVRTGVQATINRFVAQTNQHPKPFTWTADPDKIIAAVRRGHPVLDSIH
jgi:hypothetical protein